MTEASDDEFATFNLDEFTEEDFRQIDEELAHQANPTILVELDSPSNKSVSHSPLAQFRWEGVLSVTDLSALAWCELQFDYGLRQRRSRPLLSRPTSFVSKQGKTIAVEYKTAVKNDNIQSTGKAVHKQLEKEIPMQEVEVAVSYPEERWALRLVNMMASVNCLLDYGITREMPVFGILNGVLVFGIIDEVTREPAKPKTSTKAKSSPKKQKASSPSQAQITEFLPDMHQTSIQEALPTPKTPSHTLHLSDTKTRKTNSLPAHPDTLPARIQLMLYRRLLNHLLSPTYDFSLVWDYLGLNPERKLSDRFLKDAGLFWKERSINCLADIGHQWNRMKAQLGVSGVNPNLKLVYRLQPKGHPSPSKSPDLLSIQENIDLAHAIEASLCDVSREQFEASADEVKNKISAPQNRKDVTITSLDDVGIHSPTAPTSIGQIIGTKKFLYQEDFLDSHLVRALEWWLGQREPEGVVLDKSHRCHTCEYAVDCEWREQKAMEFRGRMSKG